MIDDILIKMDERKAYKNFDRYEHNLGNEETINDCRNAKENCLNTQCEEIEELEKQQLDRAT